MFIKKSEARIHFSSPKDKISIKKYFDLMVRILVVNIFTNTAQRYFKILMVNHLPSID